MIAEISDKIPSLGTGFLWGMAVACLFFGAYRVRRSLAWLAIVAIAAVNITHLAVLTDTIDGMTLAAMAGVRYLFLIVVAMNAPLLCAMLAALVLELRSAREPSKTGI